MADRITKRAVDAAEPGRTLWDGELRGFGLRVSKTGVRAYVVKYRTVEGRQRFLTIGRHGSPWTPDAARKAALEALAAVRRGEDPAAEKKAKREGVTVEGFGERYFRDHARPRNKTADADEATWRRHVLPRLGGRKLAQVTRADVARLHVAMGHTPIMANRVLALLSSAYTKAAEWGEVAEGMNPTRGVERYAEKPRKRYLSAGELEAVGRALAELEAEGQVSPYALAAIRMIALTGARRDEVLTLRWADVDLAGGVARLPDSKTGEKDVHLPAAAVALLHALPRQAGNPYVFCGKKEGARFVGLRKVWLAVLARADVPHARLHDLRHSFASVAASSGQALGIIGAMLGHTQASTTQRYAHLSADPIKAAAEATGAKIAAAMGGLGGEAIPLRPVASEGGNR